MYSIEISPKAKKELMDASEWYDEDQIGLGEKFEREVLRKIKLIVSNPLQYPLKKKMREANTDKFPYLIVYRINEKQNLIISVFHTSRHPRKKYRL
jgi:plasmid stabilization system protein ParE